MRTKTLPVMLACLTVPVLTFGQDLDKAELRQLLRDLADEAFENLVLQDTDRRAYAHLLKLVAYRLMDLEGTEEIRLISDQNPAEPMPHVPLPESVLRIQGLK